MQHYHQDINSDVDISALGPLTICHACDASLGSLQLCQCVSLLHGWEFCNPIDTQWGMSLRGTWDSRAYLILQP